MDISDQELTQIEKEVQDYQLEDYPITGVQVRSIISRLRRAEEAADTMAPFMRYYMDRDRLKRANEAWILPRVGVFFLSVIAGALVSGYSGLMFRAFTYGDVASVGFAALSWVIPCVGLMVPLNHLIDRTQHKRLLEGRYDSENYSGVVHPQGTQLADREMSVPDYN